ncbi:hypothetical protein ABIA39_007656 [Nocardia sp. GAS34]
MNRSVVETPAAAFRAVGRSAGDRHTVAHQAVNSRAGDKPAVAHRDSDNRAVAFRAVGRPAVDSRAVDNRTAAPLDSDSRAVGGRHLAFLVVLALRADCSDNPLLPLHTNDRHCSAEQNRRTCYRRLIQAATCRPSLSPPTTPISLVDHRLAQHLPRLRARTFARPRRGRWSRARRLPAEGCRPGRSLRLNRGPSNAVGRPPRPAVDFAP